jgi:UDP-glucose 4-epimerase
MKTRRTILVTGAYGFLGRHVAQFYNRQGHYVIGVGHGAWARSEWSAWGLSEWHTADITVESLITYARTPDVIAHCAGSGSVAFSVQHPALDFRRTVEATSRVLEFIRVHAPAASLVYPSSAAVYGANPAVPTSEAAELKPVSPYGLHKQMAEELCCMYASNFQVRVTIVRLFSIYGPELRKQLLWDGCHKLLRGVRDFPGSGEETRDWVNVQDAVALLGLAADRSDATCPIINGGRGEAVTVRQILEALREESNLSGNIRFNGEKRAGDPRDLVANPTAALALGWRPTIAWRQGIVDYVRWFKTAV